MRGVTLLATGGLLLAGAALAEGNPEAGRKLANMCRTCHGVEGLARIPIAPHIGGEPAEYLAAQLMSFKTGARVHEMMTVVAGGLSEDQIADVAAWYAAQVTSATLAADEGGAPELCSGCHGANGISLVEDAPNLAGESAIYIDTQLKAFRSGKRVHEVMSDIAADLTDAEIRAAADWYAAVQLEISPPPE